MEEKKNVCEGTGKIEEKSEAVTKKGDKYWKFKVNNKMFSLFEYPAGHDVSVGDNVKMYWTEKESTSNNQPVTYRNINSIFKTDENLAGATLEPVPMKGAEYKHQPNDPFLGMVFNKAVDCAIAHKGEGDKGNVDNWLEPLYLVAKRFYEEKKNGKA